LIEVLGGSALKVTYASKPPTVILLAGLQGAGKTTTAAKLAAWFKQQGRQPYLIAADLQRPAAVEQLRVLGAQVGVDVFSEPSKPIDVARHGLKEATRLGRDVVIIDTAGRLSIDEALMDEVRSISKVTLPHYTFLVIDAVTGQDAVVTARAFHETLALSGIIVTKLDYDARGGAVLSARGVVGRPVVFASSARRWTISSSSTPTGWPHGSSDGRRPLVDRAGRTAHGLRRPRRGRRANDERDLHAR